MDSLGPIPFNPTVSIGAYMSSDFPFSQLNSSFQLHPSQVGDKSIKSKENPPKAEEPVEELPSIVLKASDSTMSELPFTRGVSSFLN